MTKYLRFIYGLLFMCLFSCIIVLIWCGKETQPTAIKSALTIGVLIFAVGMLVDASEMADDDLPDFDPDDSNDFIDDEYYDGQDNV